MDAWTVIEKVVQRVLQTYPDSLSLTGTFRKSTMWKKDIQF